MSEVRVKSRTPSRPCQMQPAIFSGKNWIPAEILNVKENPREPSFSLILTENLTNIFCKRHRFRTKKRGGLNMSKASNVGKQE